MDSVQHNILQERIEDLEFALRQCSSLARKIVDVDEAHYEATRIIEIARAMSGKKF